MANKKQEQDKASFDLTAKQQRELESYGQTTIVPEHKKRQEKEQAGQMFFF